MKGETFQPARDEHQRALYLSVHPQLSSSPGEEVEEHFPATTPRTISKLRGDAGCWQCGCLGAALPTSIISSLIYEPKGKQHVRQVVDLKLPAVTSYSLELVQRAACRCG